MSEKGDSVLFQGLPRSVPPGEDLKVNYRCAAGLARNARDWVGLFRVGWTSSRDYFTFEWAPQPPRGEPEEEGGGEGSVTFAGRRLPPEDGHFYQLCYVSPNGTVRGASAPLQFSAGVVRVEEVLEVVEVEEGGSLMVVRPKEDERLTEQLQQQLQVKREAEAHLVEKLEAERASSSELTAALTAERVKSMQLSQSLEEVQEKETALVAEMAQLTAAADELTGAREREGEVRAMSAELQAALEAERGRSQELRRELEEAQTLYTAAVASGDGRLQQVSSQLAETTAEVSDIKQQLTLKEAQVCDLEQLVAVSRANQESQDEMSAQRQQEVEQLQQELTVAQENIAELMGMAGHTPTPPPPPSASTGETVDRSVYDALLQAYENMEQYYREASGVREQLEQQNALLVARVEQCRELYQNQSRQLLELRRQCKTKAEAEGERQQLEELTETCERAAQELSMRQEQVKGQEVRISELEGELERLGRELEQFQEKHDSRMAEKSDALAAQQRLLAKREAELAQLKARLRGGVAGGLKTCPVCGLKFPASTGQPKFEEHVQAHFRD